MRINEPRACALLCSIAICNSDERVRVRDRRAFLLTADEELTFRFPLCAFFVLLSYRIHLSLEHPKLGIALVSYRLKCDNQN